MQAIEHFERSTTITKKGQVTIPVEIRRALGVGPHDKVAFVVEHNQVHLRPAGQGVVARTAGALKEYFPNPPLTAEEERRRFEEGVAKEAGERST